MNALQQIEALRKEFSALQSKLDMARNQAIKEQPTPEPEPPTVGRRISRAEALQIAKDIGIKAEQERQAQNAPEPPKCVCGHSKREHEVFGVCQGSECGCMGYEKPEPPKPWPIEYSAIGAAIVTWESLRLLYESLLKNDPKLKNNHEFMTNLRRLRQQVNRE